VSLGYNISLPRDLESQLIMSFNFHARYALITYSQCGDLCPWSVVELFSTLSAECIIGREDHEDGGTHLHAFVDFGKKYRTRDCRKFDVGGCHPNVEPSRGTPEKGWDYAVKDGNVVAGGLERPTPSGGGKTTVDKWSAITSATSRGEFWELVHELDPKAAACSFTSLSKYADWKFAVDPPEYESPTGIDFFGGEFDGRDHWLAQAGLGVGESRLGK
jgi:hypothetical protein